ncbi:hypothetical protein VTL71DRAFT_9587 [Oculimacula yallundae]|uniref:phospholipase D n=1 Tax=Oculimacula yallundae TaxID=86028 RepID=A0ABR4BR87_9HELO
MGWCLSPQVHLRRPPAKSSQYRLDHPALHTKLALEELHENIRVVLHTYHAEINANQIPSQQMRPAGEKVNSPDIPELYWCNHEKLCIVDGVLFTDEDFINARAFDFLRPDHPKNPKANREKDCRMAWHDPAVGVEGPVVQDLIAHFVQCWNFENGLNHDSALLLSHDHLLSKEQGHNFGGRSQSEVNIQVLRSRSHWNNGTPTEHSILSACLDIINNSQHFLYFEQQYFITATSADQYPVLNRIGKAIVERILRAARAEQKFKVIVNMPAVPAFSGDVQYDSSPGTLAIMGLQYNSICRGSHSIMGRIIEAGFDPSNYISFYNLRTYDIIDSRPPKDCVLIDSDKFLIPEDLGREEDMDNFVSEEVYVHSKLLIADDRVVVIGSANLGDRSMLGDRDSELGIVIEDLVMMDSLMNGVPFRVSRFAATMRRNLFLKHLGRAPAQIFTAPDHNFLLGDGRDSRHDWGSDLNHLVEDPLSSAFEKLWTDTARINTEVFERVFRPLPSNAVRNWEDYHKYHGQFFDRKEGSKEDPKYRYGHVFKENFGGGVKEVKQELEKIRGTLVEMPLHFLFEIDELPREGFRDKIFQAEIYT